MFKSFCYRLMFKILNLINVFKNFFTSVYQRHLTHVMLPQIWFWTSVPTQKLPDEKDSFYVQFRILIIFFKYLVMIKIRGSISNTRHCYPLDTTTLDKAKNSNYFLSHQPKFDSLPV